MRKNIHDNLKELSYISYIWNDILCCRNKFFYQKKAVGKIISFENLIEISYDYFIGQEQIKN